MSKKKAGAPEAGRGVIEIMDNLVRAGLVVDTGRRRNGERLWELVKLSPEEKERRFKAMERRIDLEEKVMEQRVAPKTNLH